MLFARSASGALLELVYWPLDEVNKPVLQYSPGTSSDPREAAHSLAMPSRPSSSPARRRPPRPRDLLVFSCNPVDAPLPKLDEEFAAVQAAYPE
eukprot:7087802-Prymnesium_polylepis.1